MTVEHNGSFLEYFSSIVGFWESSTISLLYLSFFYHYSFLTSIVQFEGTRAKDIDNNKQILNDKITIVLGILSRKIEVLISLGMSWYIYWQYLL